MRSALALILLILLFPLILVLRFLHDASHAALDLLKDGLLALAEED